MTRTNLDFPKFSYFCARFNYGHNIQYRTDCKLHKPSGCQPIVCPITIATTIAPQLGRPIIILRVYAMRRTNRVHEIQNLQINKN